MKKLTFVSGKGGVGKTTVSLALAMHVARQGKTVLLVEVNSEGPTDLPDSLPPGLDRLNVQPWKSFEEYVLSQLKSRLLYRAVFENRIVRHFIEATPGLADLMMIGKIHSLLDQYDHLIVDAPATGHGLSLLQIAGIVADAVRIGPLRTRAAAINAILHDRQLASLVLVTLPEELPVTELLEMREELESRLQLPVEKVFLNQIESPPFTAKEEETFDGFDDVGPWQLAMTIQRARAGRSALYRAQLKKELGKIPLAEIPFVYASSFGLPEIERIVPFIK